MSKVTEVLNTGQQAIFDTDISKIFIWNPRTENGTFTNTTGSTVTLPKGTLLGRISATGLILPLKSAAVDNSNIPVGILMNDVTVLNTASATVVIVVSGDVAEEKVIFDGADGFDTVVTNRTLRDRIGGDTVGIKLVAGTELTAFDNQ